MAGVTPLCLCFSLALAPHTLISYLVISLSRALPPSSSLPHTHSFPIPGALHLGISSSPPLIVERTAGGAGWQVSDFIHQLDRSNGDQSCEIFIQVRRKYKNTNNHSPQPGLPVWVHIASDAAYRGVGGVRLLSSRELLRVAALPCNQREKVPEPESGGGVEGCLGYKNQ